MFKSQITALILVLAMAWAGVFGASGFCSSRTENRVWGIFSPSPCRAQQIPLQGLIPCRGNYHWATTIEPDASFYIYDLMNCPDAARHDLQHGWHISMSAIAAKQCLTQKQADAAHPSLVYNHAPKTILYGYDDLGRRVSAESQNSGGQVLYQDAWSYDARGRTASHASSNGTLTYAYDAAGNLTQTQSDHPQGGHWTTYDYDALNRLGNVYDQNVDDGAGNVPAAAHYAYDGVGNLSAMSYSNGVRHAYTYNTLNRLTQLTVTDALSNVLHSYSHTLNAAGHKTQVVEADGRTVNYAFDQLHRLTSETIAASPGPMGVNGVASYAYDKVSNRISRTSSIAGVVNQSLAFNDNDQIDGGGYAYDDNGSTTQAPDGSADVYSFDNMLIRRVNTAQGLTVDMVYSATGDRVQKVTNGVAVNYLVDTNNHTGYAQVVEETDGAGNLEAVMVYGHDLISQDRTDGAGGFEMSFYSYDGLGSVRGLTDSVGTSLGNYHYDAYGTKIEDTVGIANPYLYAGERFDNDLGLYYLRARYLSVETGRFWSLDDWEGNPRESITLHKYLYANGNPVSFVDPSGNISTNELTLTSKIQNGLQSMALNFVVRFKKITKVFCKPAGKLTLQAHHLIPLNMGGPGSRKGARGEDLRNGDTFLISPFVHRGLHSVINLLLIKHEMPHGGTSAKKWRERLSQAGKTDDDMAQILLWAAVFVDTTCTVAGARGYKPIRGKLIKRLRKKKFVILKGYIVEGSTLKW